jgi:hypothetical protein
MRNAPVASIWSILFLLFFVSVGHAEQVALPLTLDHKLLTSLVIRENFSEKTQSAAIVGSPAECMYIGVAEPRFSSVGKFLRLEMRLTIRLGTPLGGECLVPVEWQGYIALVQQPIFDGESFSLAFRTIDSSLFTLNRQPATIAGFLWEFAKPRVYEHLSRVRINLAPPIRELRDFLAPLFHDGARQQAQTMIDSLRGGTTTVEKDGVVVQLLAEVEEVFEEEKAESAELSPEEHRWLVRLWETWDALLVQLIATLTVEPLRPEDQELLIDVLLDIRHAFVATLDQDDLDRDFVREQFVRAWRDLAPIFRRQLYAKPSDNSLGYLAFFTAADALAVFDRMGPTFGVEISEQGLLRLATMLTGKATPLPYGPEVDEGLRKLLQLPMIKGGNSMDDEIREIDLPPEENAPQENELQEDVPQQNEPQEIDLPPEEEDLGPFSRLSDFFFTPAYAAEPQSFGEILEWRVPQDDLPGYTERVRTVLAVASSTVLARRQLPAQLHGMYRTMIVAMAWQESCFRQFVERGKKLTYLLSYNKTSVGVMQVNERVWRGMYDLRKLRWDIRYNALAGCEIAELYLRRYALREKAPARGIDTGLLSKGVYAMYNGGPGQYEKFLTRARTGKTYLSDRAFAEKLNWVEKRDWQRISDCLGGG